MKAIDFWFDPISPYAYLAFERLPEVLEGTSYSITYRPILFAALLKHWQHKGPAEIEPKRAWTFRQVHWLAQRHGIALQTPSTHPFNPLPLLRLAYACAGVGGTPNRYVCGLLLQHVWRGGGAEATDPSRWQALVRQLAPRRDPSDPVVKEALRAATTEAVTRGLFGVPTLTTEGRLFWGLDSLDMVAAFLRADPWFDGPAWDSEGAPRRGIVR